MILSHEIFLGPTEVQATYFGRAAGVGRLSTPRHCIRGSSGLSGGKANPGLPKPSDDALPCQFNAIQGGAFPWMLAVAKNAAPMAILHRGQAFHNVLAGSAEYPPFKTRGRHDSFTLFHDPRTVKGQKG